MLETILVAVDASTQHAAILDQAAELAIATGAKVHVATVADACCKTGLALNRSSLGVFHALGREVEDILRTACGRLSDKGITCQTHALSGTVPEQLALLASDVRADMIVVGHRHLTWMQRIFDKSVGHDLLDRAPCSVLVVTDGAAES